MDDGVLGAPGGGVQLRLDGFEGPLDLLLELARRQEVDLARVSVSALADQYLAAIADIAGIDLMRAADWLVMAAWLTWLKSRLLLPKNSEGAEQAQRAACALTDRLAALERVRAAAAWLERQPQLGREVFERGVRPGTETQIEVRTSIVPLLRAYFGVWQGREPRGEKAAVYRPQRPVLWTAHQALGRMTRLMAELPDGSDLLRFLPELPADAPNLELRQRAAVASTLVAGLELAREARVRLRQDEAWGPILVHARSEPPADDDADDEAQAQPSP